MIGGRACARGAVASLLVALTGCSTFDYTSEREAEDVAECIADGWRHSPWSGWQAPVSVTQTDAYYFVGVELHPIQPAPVISGTRHPTYPVWAEVRAVADGSTTKYHRAYQIWHARIDAAVVDCQTRAAEPARPEQAHEGAPTESVPPAAP